MFVPDVGGPLNVSSCATVTAVVIAWTGNDMKRLKLCILGEKKGGAEQNAAPPRSSQ